MVSLPKEKLLMQSAQKVSQPHFYSFTRTFFQKGSLPASPAQSVKQLVLRKPMSSLTGHAFLRR